MSRCTASAGSGRVPPLTTVRIDGPRIGQAIAEALLARIAEPARARQPLRLDLGFELIARGSG